MTVEIKGVWDDATSQAPLYVSRETFCHETAQEWYYRVVIMYVIMLYF